VVFRIEKYPAGKALRNEKRSNDHTSAFERLAIPEELREKGARMAGGPAFPGGAGPNDINRVYNRQTGRWNAPQGGDEEETRKKNYTYNLENIVAYLTGATANVLANGLPEDGIAPVVNGAWAPMLPYVASFCLGFSASRFDSAIAARSFFGVLFSGIASIGGIALVLTSILSFGTDTLINAGFFTAGFVAGRMLKKYT
jgi:hypothetical protein